MRVITGKRVAEIYFSLQRHFENGPYSITSYDWYPIKISYERFVKKYPIKYCNILADRVITHEKMFDVCIPSLVERDWFITEFVEDLDERVAYSQKWKNRIASVKYDFTQSVHEIVNSNISLDKAFSNYILEQYLNAKISLEVFCVYILMFSLEFEDNFIWEKTSLSDKVLAYMKIVSFDIPKYKSIFMKIMLDNRE